jgi:hypothetical protein
MGTELPTKVMLGQTLVLMQMTFLNNVRKVDRLVLSRTSCCVKGCAILETSKDKSTGKTRINSVNERIDFGKRILLTHLRGMSNVKFTTFALCYKPGRM